MECLHSRKYFAFIADCATMHMSCACATNTLCGKHETKSHSNMRGVRMMKDKLKLIQEKALAAFQEAKEIKDIDELKVKFLGKKGELTAILKEMGKLSAEERPVIGQMANEVRAEIEKMLEDSDDLTLKMQSVTGELAFGGRSNQCIHNRMEDKSYE